MDHHNFLISFFQTTDNDNDDDDHHHHHHHYHNKNNNNNNIFLFTFYLYWKVRLKQGQIIQPLEKRRDATKIEEFQKEKIDL